MVAETLQIEHISEIPWNEKALDRVVLDDIKKELIKALVTNQLEKNQGADVVENKGNGMILLLHGPPGGCFWECPRLAHGLNALLTFRLDCSTRDWEDTDSRKCF